MSDLRPDNDVNWRRRAYAAEDRCDALNDVLTLADNLADRVEREDAGADEWGRWKELAAYRDARAANGSSTSTTEAGHRPTPASSSGVQS